MGFGALTSAQKILIELLLKGGPKFRTELQKSGIDMTKFAVSTEEAAVATSRLNRQSFATKQALFTARRGLFYGTLAVAGMAAAIARLGFNFHNTMEQSRVAFKGFISTTAGVNKELNQIYVLAARTPFEFPDLVLATRRLLPFTKNLELTNHLVGAVTDSLSAMGILTGDALTKASLALAHMFNVGRLTGQILYQLGRDNIPMMQALEYQFHATGNEIRTAISGGLIDAQTAARALVNFMRTPGFKGAAFKQATQTLEGAWSTFKDLLGMGAGTSMTGPLDAIRERLKAIDKALIGTVSEKHPITLSRLANAIDKVVSPKSHLVINMFDMLSMAVKTTVIVLWLLYKVLTTIMWPINFIGRQFHISNAAAKIFGIGLGILIGAFVALKTASLLVVLVQDIWAMRLKTLLPIVKTLGKITRTEAQWLRIQAIWQGKVYNNTITGAKGQRKALNLLEKATWATRKSFDAFWKTITTRVIPALTAWVAETWALIVANAVLIGVIALIVLAIALIIGALVLLYFKWGWFHKLVDRTWGWIVDHKKLVYGALIFAFSPLVGILIMTGHLRDAFNAIKTAIQDIGKAWKAIPDWVRHPVSFTVKRIIVPVVPGAGMVTGGHGESTAHRVASLVPGVNPARTAFGLLPWHQMGGTVAGPYGTPQLIMAHGGETVTPVGQAQWDRAGGNDRPIHVTLMLDRKVLAQAVARANQDYAARR